VRAADLSPSTSFTTNTWNSFPASIGVSKHNIVFDHLVAPTAFYISGEEFQEWWQDIHATEVVIGWRNKNSWRGFGRVSSLPETSS
jgi:hypothetical protein